MSELDDFLANTLPRHVRAGTAFLNGDPEPFAEMWSTNDPRTLFPPEGEGRTGWDGVSRHFRTVASHFSNGTPLRLHLLAAGVSGDLAYTVGYERSAASFDGGPRRSSTLRVTHVYRRENNDWRLVHRHGGGGPVLDRLAGD